MSTFRSRSRKHRSPTHRERFWRAVFADLAESGLSLEQYVRVNPEYSAETLRFVRRWLKQLDHERRVEEDDFPTTIEIHESAEGLTVRIPWSHIRSAPKR